MQKLHQTWQSIGVDPDEVAAQADGTIRVLPEDEREEVNRSESPAASPAAPSRAKVEDRPVAVPAKRAEEAKPLPKTGDLSAQPAVPRAFDPNNTTQDILDTALHLQVSEILLGSTLGEGGMGRVWRGYQRSLEREVAVKGLREDLDTPAMRKQLLREARVTGALEHPNIIPLHVLVKDDRGGPLMVMKRIEGEPWGEEMAAKRGEEGHLERNLRVLVQVCHAVHFAHSRGVLHRDLKPDNVMVGPYGEVYVLDWGIAVAIRDDTNVPGLKLARLSNGIVGTLHYMSPEMVGGDGKQLDVRSDVYLLGSILHEILTGEERHQGETIPQLVHNAWLSEPPTYGPEVPAELAALATAATDANKDKRPASAEAFRLAIEAWLEHRVSMRLTETAREQLDIALKLRAQGKSPDPAMRESRFGFRQALRSWEGNVAAAAGLQQSLALLMEVALEGESLETARAVLLEMDEPNARHASPRVEALAAIVETKARRLQQLEDVAAEMDLGRAATKRRVFGVGFGLTFLALHVALFLRGEVWGLDHLRYLFLTGSTAAVWAAPSVYVRRALFPNRASRRLVWSLALLLFGQAITFTGFWMLGIPYITSLGASLFPLATIILVKSVLIDTRMLWSAFATFGLGAVALAWPQLTYICVGFAYAGFFCGGALLSYEQLMQRGL